MEQDDMCAVRMFHDCAPWRPRVVLYDFDTPKGDVLVDYIMFEKTGRIDYTFNATEAQVHSMRLGGALLLPPVSPHVNVAYTHTL